MKITESWYHKSELEDPTKLFPGDMFYEFREWDDSFGVVVSHATTNTHDNVVLTVLWSNT
jgi:hypothetical protein